MRNAKRLQFSYWDVFSARKFEGNSLPVLFTSRSLSDAAMLRIAREFRTTETVFIQGRPPFKNKNEHRIRIMTPHGEIPFAGHPLLGAAAALADTSPTFLARPGHTYQAAFSLPNGRVQVQATSSVAGCDCEMAVPLAKIQPVRQPSRLLTALRLSPSQLVRGDNLVTANIGIVFHLANCRSRNVVNAIAPDWDGLRRYCHYGSSSSDCYCFAHQRRGKVMHVWARCFLGSGGEDSGTGSAAACVGSWLVARNEVQSLDRLVITQGRQGPRVSIIELGFYVDPNGVRSLRLGGAAVKLMEGWIST